MLLTFLHFPLQIPTNLSNPISKIPLLKLQMHFHYLCILQTVCSSPRLSSIMYFLLRRWREKFLNGIPPHALNFSKLVDMVSLITSIIYLLGFSGIGFVRSFVSKGNNDSWDVEDENTGQFIGSVVSPSVVRRNVPMRSLSVDGKIVQVIPPLSPEDDEVIIRSVVEGKIPSYRLKSKLGDCKRAIFIRKEALQRSTGKSLNLL